MSVALPLPPPAPRASTPPAAPSAGWRWATRVVVAYAVLYAVVVLFRNSVPTSWWIESTGFLPLYLAAGVGTWYGHRAPEIDARESVAWRLIAMGWLLSFVGATGYHLSAEPWATRAADILYRAYYPLLVLGFPLLSLPRRGVSWRPCERVDATIVIITAVILSWYLVWGTPEVGDYLRTRAPADRIVPFGEVAVLIVAGVALTRKRDRSSRGAIDLLGGGALAASIGDLLLVRSQAVPSPALQSVGDITLALSAVLFTYSGLEARRQRRPDSLALRSVLPYASLATVGVLLAGEVVWGEQVSGASRGLVAGAIALSSLVIVRLVLADRESRGEAAARVEQDRRFRALAHQSAEALLVVDHGVVTYASDAVAPMLGTGPEQAQGRTLAELGYREDSPLARAIAEPQDGALVSWEVGVEGNTRALETVISDLRTDPAVHGLVLTTRDVTERTLLERRLRQSQKLDALGQLAGGVAHDFNNLLAAIRANVDLLRQMPGADPTHELQEIVRATERGAALCHQLLAFGRPAEGARQYFMLAAALRDTLPMLRRVLPTTIALDVTVRDENARVHADRSQVDVAILNLILNARDAIRDAGTISLDLSSVTLDADDTTRADVASGAYVELRVTDSGSGMSSATLGRVFEPFFTTKGLGGTGLGLPMVYGMMKGIGGQVLVQSTEGRGTTVTLRFPRAEAVPLPSPAAAVSPPIRCAGRVLLVDDERAVREVMSKYLTRCGYTVMTAEDGASALALLEREGWRFDALVSDIVMPKMNGIALARRAAEHNPGMRLVLMSGFEPDTLHEETSEASSIARLQKPFPLEALLEHLSPAS